MLCMTMQRSLATDGSSDWGIITVFVKHKNSQDVIQRLGSVKNQVTLTKGQAGCRSHNASRKRPRAVCSRRLIVPTGLENRSLISLSD